MFWPSYRHMFVNHEQYVRNMRHLHAYALYYLSDQQSTMKWTVKTTISKMLMLLTLFFQDLTQAGLQCTAGSPSWAARAVPTG